MFNRKVFKTCVMTYDYHAGDSARKEQFCGKMKEYFISHCFLIPLADHEISAISIVLNSLFVNYALEQLKPITRFTKLTTKFVDRNKEKIEISYKYAKWSFFMRKTVVSS